MEKFDIDRLLDDCYLYEEDFDKISRYLCFYYKPIYSLNGEYNDVSIVNCSEFFANLVNGKKMPLDKNLHHYLHQDQDFRIVEKDMKECLIAYLIYKKIYRFNNARIDLYKSKDNKMPFATGQSLLEILTLPHNVTMKYFLKKYSLFVINNVSLHAWKEAGYWEKEEAYYQYIKLRKDLESLRLSEIITMAYDKYLIHHLEQDNVY